MNRYSLLVPVLGVLATVASAQTPTLPAVGTPVTIQSQSGVDGRTAYNVSSPQTNAATPQAGAALNAMAGYSRQVPQDFKLVPGDQINVRVFGQDYNFNVVLDKDGFVNLPYLGQVQLNGISLRDANDMLATKLVEAGIYNDPILQVQYIEGPGTDAAVIGELHGIVPIYNQRSLADVINSLGGFPVTASHVVTINRPGEEPLTLDLGPDPMKSPLANTPVHPGDTLITGRAGIVYVIGSFKSSGIVPLSGNQPTTLLELCATTGGPMFEAKYNDLRLIRVIDGKRTLVKLDIKRVLMGQDPDPVLQSNDILYLPSSPFKAAIGSPALSTVLSLASTAVSVASFTR